MQLKVTFEANNGEPDRYMSGAEAIRTYVVQASGKIGDPEMKSRLTGALSTLAPYEAVINSMAAELEATPNKEAETSSYCSIPQAPATSEAPSSVSSDSLGTRSCF